ncbi:MAG TPA: Hsp20/alpha crystallin family protein [Oculatellaceae cyanobacterium]
MKQNLDLLRLAKHKALPLTLSLGLALGFAGGQLRSQAQSAPKAESRKADSETQIRVHAGTSKSHQNLSDLDAAINRMRASASRLGFPSDIFELQNAPDANWMLRNFNGLASDFDGNWILPAGMTAYIPRLDTTDQGSEIRVSAEVPGMDESNLDVTVNDDSVTIKGEKKNEVSQSKTDKSFRVSERCYGTFERTVSLPCKVQSENAQASLKNGVLTIIVPKSQAIQNEGKKLTIRRE